MNAAQLAKSAVRFLTENGQSPSTQDLLTLHGIIHDDWFEEDEKVGIVRELVSEYMVGNDDAMVVLIQGWLDRPFPGEADDTIHALPSGTELSVEAALGDIQRARNLLLDIGRNHPEAEGYAADLGHVAELLTMLGENGEERT